MSDVRIRRSLSERLFSALLLLFPASFRSRFGDDMRELFRDQHAEARRVGGLAGMRGVVSLWRRTLPSLLRSAALERAEARGEHRRTRHALTHFIGGDAVLATLLADLRFAARMLRKSPAFTAIAVLVIALGAGAVTTIFSATDALVLRPLPGTTRGDRLVSLQRHVPHESSRVSASYALYQSMRRARSLEGVAVWGRADVAVTAGTPSAGGISAAANLVSGEYFRLLGVRPALGRFFVDEETTTSLANPAIVVSHGFWTTKLGADSAIVGRTVTVSGRAYTLVGVAPAEFRGVFTPIVVDAWIPLTMQPHLATGVDLADHPWLQSFGRLRDGVSIEAAHAELAPIVAAHARASGEEEWLRAFTDVDAQPLTGLPADARKALLAFAALLLFTATLVLVIASVNVAGMLSARALGRVREMALRTALGAPRWRLVRQLLTETLVLFALGGAGGMLVAMVATAALERMHIPGSEITFSLELSPDLRAFGFALGVSLVVGLAVGLVPALRGTRGGMATRLRDGGAGAGTRRGVLGNLLVVGQLACSLVLLVAAGLFTRALTRANSVDPGFDAAGVVTAYMNAKSWGYDEERSRAFYETLRRRIAAIPGVTDVAYANHLPLTFNDQGGEVTVEGGKKVEVRDAAVDAGYFEVLRIPVTQGRVLTAADRALERPRVAVINETFARRQWPDGAVGRTFKRGEDVLTVVGVVRDAKNSTLSEPARPFAYYPITGGWHTRIALLVRTQSDIGGVAAAIRAAVPAIDPALPRPFVTTLREENGLVLVPQRVAAMVTGALGSVGLLLAVVGLYGVIAWSVTRRAREMGIRVALGARRRDVIALVMREGMRLAVAGTIIGIALAAAASQLMRAYLFDVSPLDAPTFVATSLLLVAVALVANWLPARRAAAADPANTLRAE